MLVAVEAFGDRGRRNLHEQIAHEIGLQIVRGDFAEADVLPTELALAEQYRVSRTAVREAFRILAAKGLTHSRPKVGTRVRIRADWNYFDSDVLGWHVAAGSSMTFLQSLFEVWMATGPEAAMLAAERRTERQLKALNSALSTIQRPAVQGEAAVNAEIAFHQTILEASSNPLFRSLGTFVDVILRASRTLASRTREGEDRGGLVLRQSAIAAAIRDRNVSAARNAYADLIQWSRTRLPQT